MILDIPDVLAGKVTYEMVIILIESFCYLQLTNSNIVLNISSS